MAGQGMVRYHMNDKKSSFALGGAVFSYGNVEGYAPFHKPDDAKGNSLVEYIGAEDDTTMIYANGYELVEVFGEITHKFGYLPVTVMADYVTNTSADSLETGWLVGLRVGKAKRPGSWEFRYNYREVKKDAVVGQFTDSDFRGGGSDAKGHEIGGAVALADNTAFKMSYFSNKIGLEDEAASDFGRLQVDLQLKF